MTNFLHKFHQIKNKNGRLSRGELQQFVGVEIQQG